LIRDGHYGDLNFTKDLAVVLISHWEGNVMEKNREFGFLIDDRANSAERDALERIFTGYAGGAFGPFQRRLTSLAHWLARESVGCARTASVSAT